MKSYKTTHTLAGDPVNITEVCLSEGSLYIKGEVKTKSSLLEDTWDESGKGRYSSLRVDNNLLSRYSHDYALVANMFSGRAVLLYTYGLTTCTYEDALKLLDTYRGVMRRLQKGESSLKNKELHAILYRTVSLSIINMDGREPVSY